MIALLLLVLTTTSAVDWHAEALKERKTRILWEGNFDKAKVKLDQIYGNLYDARTSLAQCRQAETKRPPPIEVTPDWVAWVASGAIAAAFVAGIVIGIEAVKHPP